MGVTGLDELEELQGPWNPLLPPPLYLEGAVTSRSLLPSQGHRHEQKHTSADALGADSPPGYAAVLVKAGTGGGKEGFMLWASCLLPQSPATIPRSSTISSEQLLHSW